MKIVLSFAFAFVALLPFTAPAQAQNTLQSTTLASAVTTESQRIISVSSATNFTVGYMAFVDQEAMMVLSISGTNIGVARGAGSRATTHASGATIYVGPANYFTAWDRAGSCTSTNELVDVYTNISNGNQWKCVSSAWTRTNVSVQGINTLTPASTTTDVGSATLPFRNIFFYGTSGTPGTNNFKFTGASTSGTRTWTFQDASDTIVGRATTDTLTNKTLTSPVMTGASTNTLSATSAITSTLATGTAPFTISSTTPVANLTTVPNSYLAAGTQLTTAHIVIGTCTLGTNCAVTFTGSAAFANTNYQCSATDQTAAAATKVVNTSASVATFTGTGTDVLSYVCVGN